MRGGIAQATFFDQIETLPALSTIVHRILAVTDSPRSSATDVARVLCQDPTAAAKILRVANSPFYGAARRITEVSRAVVMLGSVGVRNLVIGLYVRDALEVPADRRAEHARVWRHAIAVAAGSDLVARRIGYDPPEEALIAGLLHDIGRLAIVTFQPGAFQEILHAQRGGLPVLEVERQRLGIDHARAGARILTNWRLPELLCQVARQHHDEGLTEAGMPASRTGMVGGGAQLLAIVILADTFARVLGIGLDLVAPFQERMTAALHALRLTEADMLQVLRRLEQRIAETTEMLGTADEAAKQPATARTGRLLWVCSTEPPFCQVSRFLLEQRGYEVQLLAPTQLKGNASSDDLIFIDLAAAPDNACSLAQLLRGCGFTRVALLQDVLPGAPTRGRDAASGAPGIPRFFTAFDLEWLEGQL